MSTVEKVRLQDFDANAYYENGPKPLLISGVLSPDDCEYCSDTLFSLSSQLHVCLQNQYEGGTDVIHVSLEEALDMILYESNSQDAYMSFCEGLLDTLDGLQEVRHRITKAKENLFLDDPDWFMKYFPTERRPTDAVVISGAGATSTLHRDPFEWTGTSLCIEGSKVWRFIDPKANVGAVDEALTSYRLESIAWDGATQSAGWQSDCSLYKRRKHALLKDAQEWSEMESGKGEELLRVGSSTEILVPELSLEFSLTTAIQEAGDLLLIPAHWWHQTFALEPSAAIASQRCGKYDSVLVLQHILNHKSVKSIDARTILEESPDPAGAVNAVLSLSIAEDKKRLP
jgi:hypothetical protein